MAKVEKIWEWIDEGGFPEIEVYEVVEPLSGKKWYQIHQLAWDTWAVGIPTQKAALKAAKHLSKLESFGSWEDYVYKKFPNQGIRMVRLSSVGQEGPLMGPGGAVAMESIRQIFYHIPTKEEKKKLPIYLSLGPTLLHELGHLKEAKETKEAHLARIDVIEEVCELLQRIPARQRNIVRREIAAWKSAADRLRRTEEGTKEWKRIKPSIIKALTGYSIKDPRADAFSIMIGERTFSKLSKEEEADLEGRVIRVVEAL